MDNQNLCDIVYRFHSLEDLDTIADLEEAIFNPPWSKKALCEFVAYDTNKILVASLNGFVVGYITYSTVLDEIQIANVAVNTEHRKRGIAQGLLRALHDIGSKNNIKVITLEVRQSNDAAICLYEKMGYKKTGVRKNFYSKPIEDSILMDYAFERNI